MIGGSQPSPLGRHVVFYDGGCALCHGAVSFLVARDRRGALAFAPLHGATFDAVLPPATRPTLPDSLIVVTADGDLLLKSQAVVRALRLIGFPWAIAGALLGILPRRLADAGYDAVARRRSRLGAPPSACPIVPASLRERLLP